MFLDAALVRWKPGHKIKAFRRGKKWVDDEHPRKQDLGPSKLYQFYSAMTLGPDKALYRHPLIFVPAGKGLTAKLFVKEVAAPILAWAHGEVFPKADCYFVQDNATCHTARSTEQWMHAQGYKLHEHPPQSPDLNRIEKAWAYFKDSLEKRAPRTEQGLFKALQHEWMALESSTLGRFISELPDVMRQVHVAPKKLVQK